MKNPVSLAQTDGLAEDPTGPVRRCCLAGADGRTAADENMEERYIVVCEL